MRSTWNCKEYAETVFTAIPDGLVVLSSELTILSANRTFLKRFGLAAETIRGRQLMEVIAAAGLRERALEVMASGTAQHDLPYSMGAVGDSARKPVRVTLTGIHLAEEEAQLLMIVEDVSEEERLRTQARVHETRYRDLVEGLDAIVWEAEAATFAFTFVSRRAEAILGYPVGRWLKELDFWIGIIHPEDREQTLALCRAATAQGNDHVFDYRAVAADGRIVWLHDIVHVVRDETGRAERLRGVMLDITERKRTEQVLHDSARRLQGLSRRLIAVEETERRNINRELHDRVGQTLAALNINLNIIRSQLPQESLDVVSACLQDTQTLLEETVAQTRDIMTDLHPPVLDDYGLLAALRTHAKSFGARVAVPITVHGEDLAPRGLSLAAEMALFRVAQGALTNAVTHARAKRIQVMLAATPDRVTLTIADDGAGFDVVRAALAHASWGLSIMRERAEAVGARLTVESTPGKGTRVVVEIKRGAA